MRKNWLACVLAMVLCMGSAVTIHAEETDNAVQTVSETEQGSDIVQNVDAEEQADDTTQDADAGGQTDGTEANTDYPTATLTLVWHFGEWGKDSNGNYDTGSYTEAGSLVMETKTIILDQQDENGNYYYDGEAIKFDYEKEHGMMYVPLIRQYYTYNGIAYSVGFYTYPGSMTLIDDRAVEYTTVEGSRQLLRGTSKNILSDGTIDENAMIPSWCDANSGVVYHKFVVGSTESGWIIKTYGDAVCHVYFAKDEYENIVTDTENTVTDTENTSNTDSATNTGNNPTTGANVYGGTGIIRGDSIDFPIEEVDETTLTDAQKASVQKYGEAMKELTGVEASNCKIIDLIDIRKPDGVTDEELSEGIDITFPVSWVASSDKIIVLHLKSDGVWELLPATAGDGKITAKFTSLSPVMIAKVSEETAADGTEQGTHVHSYYDQVVAPTADTWGYTTHTCECGYSYADNYVAPLSKSAGDAAVSPKTGETDVPYAAVCAMLAAMGVVAITAGRKARTGK